MYCPRCKILVSPCDPERVQIEIDTWHGPCLKAQRRELEEDLMKLKNHIPYLTEADNLWFQTHVQ